VSDDVVRDDVVIVDITLIELALNVEYAATPGVPLLILETVRVEREIFCALIVDPDIVE
jgi:hypothetical protein